MKTNPSDPIKIFKALSDETRLRILCLLDKHELSVNDIVEIMSSSQSRISRHLTVLKETELLECRREGTWAFYRKANGDNSPPEFKQVWDLIKKWSRNREDAVQDRGKLQELLLKKSQRSHAFHGKHAKRWDEIRKQLCGEMATLQAFESLIPQTLTAADIGTGTGHLLIPLARILSKVIGVDHSREMLDMAKRKVKESNLENVDLREGEIDDLPIEDETVDAVFAGLVLHHAPNPAAAVDEMARIVKPGGTVTLIDLQRHNEDWMREELADLWLGFEEKDVKRWFSQAGLEPVRWIDGLPPADEKGNPQSPIGQLRSFIFYGRKPVKP